MLSIFSSCSPRFSVKAPCITTAHFRSDVIRGASTKLVGQRITITGSKALLRWSFASGSRIFIQPKAHNFISCNYRKVLRPTGILSSQIASDVFTLGTVAVLPFYTLMILAPKANLTKRIMESYAPHVILGVVYTYLLYLSWTPDSLGLLFASNYWLPELSGISKMFSNDVSLASAWVHLLVVDLFAARQIFHDGLQNKIETRLSICLCLLCCPLGIVTHAITKVVTRLTKHRN